MMDYFDSGQVSDFSVSDVFDAEVKTEIDELLNTETTPFAQETVTNMDLGTGLPSSADMGLEITELQAWDEGLTAEALINDGSLNASDIVVSNSNNLLGFSPDKYGFESSQNIFVDPQTGLPSTQTIGGTHIHAQQVNLFVNSATGTARPIQSQQQTLLQQGIHISPSKGGFDQTDRPSYGQQFNHISNGHLQTQPREFTHYQLQNGQGQTLVSERKKLNGVHRLHNSSIIKSAKHQPYPTAKPQKKHNITKNIKMEQGVNKMEKVYSKPCYSYSCLITMALRNSAAGCLPVSEIYYFMCENFPYFKTAKDGWKNSVRHNLSLNKCFAKVETAVSNVKTGKKGCLWAMNPERAAKMEEEVHKSTKRDPIGIRKCMAKPEDFPKIEALSSLTHPKNLKNAGKTNYRQSCSSQKRAPTTNSLTTSNSKVKAPTRPSPRPIPVSLKKVDLCSTLSHDFFNQDFNHLLESSFLDGDLGLQSGDNLSYDMVEIVPFDVPISTPVSSFTASVSPYKDNSQMVNSRILGLDTSPITTLANSHFNSLDSSKQLTAFM